MNHDKEIERLFVNNRNWSDRLKREDSDFFSRLRNQQHPQFLWIGCSDSRVPANQIVGLLPGEVFVHRNVANVVSHTDFNCLSVMQYAVDVLKVKHIIVCGHYGCGGVMAAHDDLRLGIVDNWLENIKNVHRHHQNQFDAIPEREGRINRLCELNVIEQVRNVSHTTIVRSAWERGQELHIHGFIYGVADGVLKDLNVSEPC